MGELAARRKPSFSRIWCLSFHHIPKFSIVTNDASGYCSDDITTAPVPYFISRTLANPHNMASSDPKVASQEKPAESNNAKPEEPPKPTANLGEDDEFEDFPVDGSFPFSPLKPLKESC